ncbi:MAG: hypothetical protein AAF654_14120 [Myxococcota bacterium]
MSSRTILDTVSTGIVTVPENSGLAEAVSAAHTQRTDVAVELTPEGRFLLEQLAAGENGAAYAQAHLNVATYAALGNLWVDRNGDGHGERGLILGVDPALEGDALAVRVDRTRVILDAVLHFLDDSRENTMLKDEYATAHSAYLTSLYINRFMGLRAQHGITGSMSDLSEAEFIAFMDELRSPFFRAVGDGVNPTFLEQYNDDRFVLADVTGDMSHPADTATFDPTVSRTEGPYTDRPRYTARVPGTELERTPVNYAEALRNARGKDERILRLLIGLGDEELTQVAYLYTDNRMPEPVPENNDPTRRRIVAEFQEQVVEGLGRQNTRIARAVIDGEGYMTPETRLYLNATGFRSQNGPAVHAQLEAMTPVERDRAFDHIQELYDVSREDLLSGIRDDDDRRYARFLSVAPKAEDGTIDRGWVLAYEMMSMSGDFGFFDRLFDQRQSDINFSQLVDAALSATPEEMARAATAYEMLSRINEEDFSVPRDAPAVPDAHPDVVNSAMAAELTAEARQRIGMISRGRENTEIVENFIGNLVSGLRYDPLDVELPDNGDVLGALQRHNAFIAGNNAEVIALALELERLGAMDQITINRLLGQVDREYADWERRPITGRPIRSEVRAATAELGLDDHEVARLVTNAVGDRGMQAAAILALDHGMGYQSPEATAALAYAALHGPGGADRARFYQALDLSAIPYRDRQNYLNRVNEIYAELNAERGTSIRVDAGHAFEETLTFEGPNGPVTIASRAMILAEFGYLSAPQQIVYGRYENNSLLGVMPVRDPETILAGLNQIQGGGAYLAPATLARMVGMEYDPAHPEAVYDAILGDSTDPRIQYAATQALPSMDDAGRAEIELLLFFLRPDNPMRAAAINAEVEERFGIHPNEYIHMFTADLNMNVERGQREVQELYELISGGQPPGDFVRTHIVPPDVIAERTERVGDSLSRGFLMGLINDALGNEYEVISHDLNALAQIAQRAEAEILATGAPSEETLERAAQIQRSLMRNVPNLHELEEGRRELMINALSAAVMVGGSVAGLNALALSFFNGVARSGMTAAVGNYNLYDIGAQGVRGLAAGALASWVAGSVTAYDPTGDFQFSYFAEYVAEASIHGATAAAASVSLERFLDPAMHRFGTGRAAAESGIIGLAAVAPAAGTTALVAAATAGLQEFLTREESMTVDLEEPDDPTPPDGPGQPPPDIPGNADESLPTDGTTELLDTGGNTDGSIPSTGETQVLDTGGNADGSLPTGPVTGNPGIVDGGTETPLGPTIVDSPVAPGTPTDGLPTQPVAAPVGPNQPVSPQPTATPVGPVSPQPTGAVQPVGPVQPGQPQPTIPGQVVASPIFDRPLTPVNGSVESPLPLPPPSRDPVLGSNPIVPVQTGSTPVIPVQTGGASLIDPGVVQTPTPLDITPIVNPTSGTSQITFDLGNTSTDPITSTIGDVLSPTGGQNIVVYTSAAPTAAELQTVYAADALLDAYGTIDSVTFIWETDRFTNANMFSAWGGQAATQFRNNRNGLPEVHSIFGEGPVSLANMVAGTGVLAYSLLHDQTRQTELEVSTLEAAAQSFSGLPEGYERLTTDDERRVAILEHIANSAFDASYDYEETYGLPDGWTIDETTRAVVRESPDAPTSVAVDGPRQSITAPVREPIRPVGDQINELLGELNPAGYADDPDWYRQNFLPVLELMNGLEPGSLSARMAAGEEIPAEELERYLAVVERGDRSARSALTHHETNAHNIFEPYESEAGQDGNVTELDFELMGRIRGVLGEDITAPQAVAYAHRVAEFLQNARRIGTGASPEETVVEANQFLAQKPRLNEDGTEWIGPEMYLDPELASQFVTPEAAQGASDYAADAVRHEEVITRPAQLRQPISAQLALENPDWAVVRSHLETMRADAADSVISARAYADALREVAQSLASRRAAEDRVTEFLREGVLRESAVIEDLMMGPDGPEGRAGGLVADMNPDQVREVAERLFDARDAVGDGTLAALPISVVNAIADRMDDSVRSGATRIYVRYAQNRLARIAGDQAGVETQFRDQFLATRGAGLDFLLTQGQEEQAAESFARMVREANTGAPPEGLSAAEQAQWMHRDRTQLLVSFADRLRNLANDDRGRMQISHILLALTDHGEEGIAASRELIELTLFDPEDRRINTAQTEFERVYQWDNIMHYMVPTLNPLLVGYDSRQAAFRERLERLGRPFIERMAHEIRDGQGMLTFWGSDEAVEDYLNEVLAQMR